jgi:hypothetical protein
MSGFISNSGSPCSSPTIVRLTAATQRMRRAGLNLTLGGLFLYVLVPCVLVARPARGSAGFWAIGAGAVIGGSVFASGVGSLTRVFFDARALRGRTLHDKAAIPALLEAAHYSLRRRNPLGDWAKENLVAALAAVAASDTGLMTNRSLSLLHKLMKFGGRRDVALVQEAVRVVDVVGDRGATQVLRELAEGRHAAKYSPLLRTSAGECLSALVRGSPHGG